MTAVFATIWVALVLFVAAESGRAFSPPGKKLPSWVWWTFVAGWALAIVHTLLAFGVVHGWSHDDAVASTARQTKAMFGRPFGAGVYVNYLFFAVWLADAWWWRAAPAGYVRPAAATWMLRAFYMVMIVNAAVIFVPGVRRYFGLLLVSWLARIWAPGFHLRHRASVRGR